MLMVYDYAQLNAVAFTDWIISFYCWSVANILISFSSLHGCSVSFRTAELGYG